MSQHKHRPRLRGWFGGLDLFVLVELETTDQRRCFPKPIRDRLGHAAGGLTIHVIQVLAPHSFGTERGPLHDSNGSLFQSPHC